MHKNRFLSIFGDLVYFLSNLLTAVFYYLIPSSDDRANNFARGVLIHTYSYGCHICFVVTVHDTTHGILPICIHLA